MRHLRRLARIVLRVEGSPSDVARAFGVGVFLAFFPLYGTHTLLALAVALAFRLNRVAILAGTFTNNPWTFAPMYSAGTLLGCALLGVSPAEVGAIDWSLSGRTLHESLLTGLRTLLWPFVLGNLTLGVLAGSGAFVALRGILRSRRSPGAARPRPGPAA